MLLPALLREFLFLQAFLYVSIVADQNMDYGSDRDENTTGESGVTMGDDNDYQTTRSSDPPTTARQRKAFFARDPPKPAQSDTAETSTTMSVNEGAAIPDGADQNTTPSPTSPAQAPVFFARDPPGPSQSSETTEMPGSDNGNTRTTKEPESGDEDLRTTKDPSEDVTTTITTKKPESDDENSNNNGRNEFNTRSSDGSSDNRRSRNINHVRPVNSSRDPSDSRSKVQANNVEGFGHLSTNHVSSKEPHYHVQVLNSGVAIPKSPEETTTNRRNSSQSRNPAERSSQARSINLTILKFLMDTLTKLIPRKNMRRAFNIRNMSAKTVKTLMYGIVFHFPNGTEVPDAENTCQVLDKALSDNFERVKPLKNSLLRIVVSAAAKFLMFNKVLSLQNEPDLSEWFVTCLEESLGDVSHPTEKQSMYAIGDGFVNFFDSMDLYIPSTAKVLAKYIADGLYAVV